MKGIIRRIMRLLGRRTCEDVVSTLHDYFEHTLDAETATLVQQHLRNCPDCDAFAESYQMLIQLTGELACDDIPEEVKLRVEQALHERADRG